MQLQTRLKTNNIGSGLISLLMKLVQFILSFHIFFQAWKQLWFSQAQLVSPLVFFLVDSILF